MNLCPICNLEIVAHTLNDEGAISQYIHAGGNSCSADRLLTPRALDAATYPACGQVSASSSTCTNCGILDTPRQ